jgi:hypothetical protein
VIKAIPPKPEPTKEGEPKKPHVEKKSEKVEAKTIIKQEAKK